MRVKALQKIQYAKQERAPGDIYEMDDREEGEARILATIGKIEILQPAQPNLGRTYQATALTPEATVRSEQPPVDTAPAAQQTQESKPVGPMTTESAEALAPRPRREYRRRDMKAER